MARARDIGYWRSLWSFIGSYRRRKRGIHFLSFRLLIVEDARFSFYKRSVAVVVVTELKIKVLSNGTYCLVISLMTSWAAHPPENTETEITEIIRHQNVFKINGSAFVTLRNAEKKVKGTEEEGDWWYLSLTCDMQLTNKCRNGMQLSRTIATHFMKIIVFGKTTPLATQVIQKTRETSLLLRWNCQIVINKST